MMFGLADSIREVVSPAPRVSLYASESRILGAREFGCGIEKKLS